MGDANRRTKRVQVGQVETTVQPGDSVADLLDRTDDGNGIGDVNPETTAVVLADDVVRTDKGPRMPDEDDYVPADLSTVEDGDALELFRIRAADRPAYPSLTEA